MNEIINLVNSMSPFLLLGFFLAGLMHAFVPGRLYQQHLSKPTFKSVLCATLIAIPLPLCSCGVIPTAMSLRKEGASKGSVISFLIATPQTGLDSILATYSLMGLPFAIVRPIAALVTALFGGQLANLMENKLNDHGNNPVSIVNEDKGHTFKEKMITAIRYSFYEMMQDIGKWLAVGLIIAGLITIYVPNSFFAQFSDNTLLSIFIVLLFAIPMYLCATGSIPIAIALMLKGLSPGAALVLLMAGPAVNMASILVINKVMGWRTLAIYIFSIVMGATLFALGIDYLFPRSLFIDPLIENSSMCHEGTPLFKWICSATLILLLANALFRRFFVSSKSSCSCGSCGIQQTTSPLNVIAVEGMKCNHCKTNVENAISKIEGVKEVDADLASGKVNIQGKCSMDEVKQAVEDLGFKVNILSVASAQTVKVEGMKCNHCKANVEKAILSVAGVTAVNADLASATATIQGEFNIQDIVKSVEEIGFKVILSQTPMQQTIKVEGMKCNHCKTNVEKAIAKVKGVTKVEADLASATASIEGSFNMDEVVKSIEDLGFKVVK